MNHPAPANSRYKPTCYEHAANCYTHAVSTLVASFPIFFFFEPAISINFWGFGLLNAYLCITVFLFTASGFVHVSVKCTVQKMRCLVMFWISWSSRYFIKLLFTSVTGLYLDIFHLFSQRMPAVKATTS